MTLLIHENVALAPLTTLGIGGPARYFIDAHSENTVLEAVRFAQERGFPMFVLGGGSNLVVSDEGFAGVVLRIGIDGIEWRPETDPNLLAVGAGEPWDRVVEFAVDRDLAGIECLSGIPGSAGGTPVQNVGAYGQEISEVLVSVRAFDHQTNSIVELSKEDCGFTYRASIFNTSAKGRYIVLRVTYRLSKGMPPALRYPDVRREFEGANAAGGLREVREAVRRIRARKAMLLVEGDPDCRSAGSFFKNPIISESEFEGLQAAIPADALPRYPGGPGYPGYVKTSAAWLIERAGFSRGFSLGPAGISSKHTLALVNKGGATAKDLVRLALEIRRGVERRFGIRLIPEPVFLGFDEGEVAGLFD